MTNKLSASPKTADGGRARGRRSNAQASSTRARILRRAERLFAANGYRGVSMRDLARRSGVRMFTIQHHFGSKLALYREILRLRDREVQALLGRILAEQRSPRRLVERVVDELFDFFLAHRDSVALGARAVLGEGLPRRVSVAEHGWVRFMSSTMRLRRIGAPGIDVRLLLITVEGILNNHALAVGHYHQMFGRDVTDPEITARTKAHLKRVILSILGSSAELSKA
ncbi:MAG: TetR/AcrR family transcriptional regulator [Candidatus Binatia bacterium]